jgi:hypothetical protein
MTTVYSSVDKSAHDGRPFELFMFEGPMRNYYYSNGDVPVTWLGQSFLPVQIERGPVEVGSVADSPVLTEFTMSSRLDLARDYGQLDSPPELKVSVFRRHHGATGYRKTVLGLTSGHKMSKDLTTYTIGVKNKLQTEIARSASPVYFQNQCNNMFGDERCQFNFDPLIISPNIVGVHRTFIETDADVEPGYYVNGAIVIGNQRRMIIANDAHSFEIAYPFVLRGEVPPTCNVILGCDRSFAMCRDKYDNTKNYTGFVDIPSTNPADSPLNKIVQDFLATKKADTIKVGKTKALGQDNSNNWLGSGVVRNGTDPYNNPGSGFGNQTSYTTHGYYSTAPLKGASVLAGSAGWGDVPKDQD